MKEIELIQQFEKIFLDAGKLARNLRKDASPSNKMDSGIKEIDIVTSSDLTVQEFILSELFKSDLKNCELVAEEKTPTKNLFAKSSDLVITLDPIDGTYNYATGKKMYSTIVTLHDKNVPIYTFDYFPEVDWGIKIIEDKIEFLGQTPEVPSFEITPKIIGFTNYKGETQPSRTIPKLHDELTKSGYTFKTKQDIGEGFGPVLFFLLGLTDGLFIEDPSAVDGLVGLHFGLANNFTIYRNIDISKTKESDLGGSAEYKGYYLVLRN